MGFLNIITGPITGLVKAVGGLIDGVTTTSEEKLTLQAKLNEIQNAFVLQLAALDTQFATEQAKVVMAEANSGSYLARNWRPILMLVFTAIIAHNYVIAPMFSLSSFPIPDQMWELLKIGMGGYIFGRSVEKTVPMVTGNRSSEEEVADTVEAVKVTQDCRA
jgi:hypothetical protein